jgi:hypothetical protein
MDTVLGTRFGDLSAEICEKSDNTQNLISVLWKKTKCSKNQVLVRKPNKCAIVNSSRLGFMSNKSSVNTPSGFRSTKLIQRTDVVENNTEVVALRRLMYWYIDC